MATDQFPQIKRAISPHVAEPAPQTWSNCLVVNGVAYVAGMIARGNDGKILAGDEYEQAKLIFAKIRHLVEAAGGKVMLLPLEPGFSTTNIEKEILARLS